MADDEAAAPSIRLVNFVSEDQLEEARRTRGPRIEDGTAQRDRSLYEVLKENKDKKDAEFNERFKHRPPKALDEDETEFLDKLEMTRREYERQVAEEELQQLRSFQLAVASQTNVMHHEQKDMPSIQKNEQDKSSLPGKKNPSSRAPVIKLMPKAKKAKLEGGERTDPQETVKKAANKPANTAGENKNDKSDDIKFSSASSANATDSAKSAALGGLVSYSDESEDDE